MDMPLPCGHRKFQDELLVEMFLKRAVFPTTKFRDYFECHDLRLVAASAVVVPCLTSLVASYGTMDQKGTVMGIFRSLGAMARALGPVLACTIYWCFGALTCYTLGAVALVVPCVLLARVKATHTD